MKALLPHNRLISHSLLLLMTALLFSGCHKRTLVADKHYYPLRPGLDWVAGADKARNLPLYVPRAQAVGVVGSRPILATADDGSLVQMHHHFWLDSPRVLWQNLALDWAARTRLWPEIRGIKPLDPHHDTLWLTVLALHKNKRTAHLRLRAELQDENRKVRYQATFTRQQELPDHSVGAFVTAINGMSEAIVREMDAGIRRALKDNPDKKQPAAQRTSALTESGND